MNQVPAAMLLSEKDNNFVMASSCCLYFNSALSLFYTVLLKYEHFKKYTEKKIYMLQ